MYCKVYELLRGTLGLRRKLAVFVKNPTPIPIPHSETEPQHVVTDSTLSLRVPCTDSDSLVASSVRVSVHGTRNERVESVTTCWGSVSECGMGIGVGFFTETASFLRNPRVPRNSSYVLKISSTLQLKPGVLIYHSDTLSKVRTFTCQVKNLIFASAFKS